MRRIWILQLRLRRLIHRRHYIKQITDDAIVGHAENGCFTIFVDGDDHLARTHAGQVLHSAADAASDVQIRAHDLAGLSDLVLVFDVAGIDRRPGCANCRPRVSASSPISWKPPSGSVDTPRPPETMTLASVRLTSPASACSTFCTSTRLSIATGATTTTSALPPTSSAGSAARGRSVAYWTEPVPVASTRILPE